MRQYFKIGEISRLYHIGVDSLRYYEELGIIHPQRSESGYRLYSVDDIWRLNVIRELRQLGFSMERIGRYLENHTVDTTVALLEEEEEILQEKLRQLQRVQKNVEKRKTLLQTARCRTLETITEVQHGPRGCYVIPEGYQDEHEMDVLIQRLLHIDQQHFYVIGSNQIGTIINREEAQCTGKLRYQAVFLMDEHGDHTLPGGTYLSVSYQGRYEQSALWARRLLAYAAAHGLELVGDILEILWIDIHTSEDVAEHITELQIRVK